MRSSLVLVSVLALSVSACAKKGSPAPSPEAESPALEGKARFGDSPLAEFAEELTTLAEASMASEKLEAKLLQLPDSEVKVRYFDKPTGKLTFHYMIAELGMLAPKKDGGYARFKLGLATGPGGLRLAEARAREEVEPTQLVAKQPEGDGAAPQPQPEQTLNAAEVPVPAPVVASIEEVLKLARADRFEELKMTSTDFAPFGGPNMVASLLDVAPPFTEAAARLAKLSETPLSYELDDVILMATDEGGTVFMVGADLDKTPEGYILGLEEDGTAFTVQAFPYMEAAAWSPNLRTICKLAAEVTKEKTEPTERITSMLEKLDAASLSPVARGLFRDWIRSSQAMTKSRVEKMLVESGAPGDWNCTALDAFWQKTDDTRAQLAPLKR